MPLMMANAVFHIRLNNLSVEEDKIKPVPINVCLAFGKHFGVIFLSTSWLDQKKRDHEKRTFLFCLSIYNLVYVARNQIPFSSSVFFTPIRWQKSLYMSLVIPP